MDAIGEVELRAPFKAALDLVPNHLSVVRVDQLGIICTVVFKKMIRRKSRQIKTAFTYEFHGPELIIEATVGHAWQISHQCREPAFTFGQQLLGLHTISYIVDNRIKKGFAFYRQWPTVNFYITDTAVSPAVFEEKVPALL